MTTATRADLHQDITDAIIRDLEAGIVPWVQPWSSKGLTAGLPRNATTGKAYSGVNVLILWGAGFMGGYATQKWLTFKQAQAIGGRVRKGEKGVSVCYADRFTPEEQRQADNPRSVPFLKRFTVFNIAQCDDLPDHLTLPDAPMPEREIIPAAEAFVAATGAEIRIGGDVACYVPALDFIKMPPQQSFANQPGFYQILSHELGHWSGAKHRLDRDLSGRFGSASYAMEELISDLCSAFVLAELGIEPALRHADYIGSWLKRLKEDKRAIFTAASLASKAASYLLDRRAASLAGESVDNDIALAA